MALLLLKEWPFSDGRPIKCDDLVIAELESHESDKSCTDTWDQSDRIDSTRLAFARLVAELHDAGLLNASAIARIVGLAPLYLNDVKEDCLDPVFWGAAIYTDVGEKTLKLSRLKMAWVTRDGSVIFETLNTTYSAVFCNALTRETFLNTCETLGKLERE